MAQARLRQHRFGGHAISSRQSVEDRSREVRFARDSHLLARRDVRCIGWLRPLALGAAVCEAALIGLLEVASIGSLVNVVRGFERFVLSLEVEHLCIQLLDARLEAHVVLFGDPKSFRRHFELSSQLLLVALKLESTLPSEVCPAEQSLRASFFGLVLGVTLLGECLSAIDGVGRGGERRGSGRRRQRTKFVALLERSRLLSQQSAHVSVEPLQPIDVDVAQLTLVLLLQLAAAALHSHRRPGHTETSTDGSAGCPCALAAGSWDT